MRKNQSAFTLLEIMLVVSIIAVLLSLAIYRLRGNLESAKMVGVQGDIQSIGTQLKVYESFNGFVPTTEQGLQALVARPSSDPQPAAGLSCSARCRSIPGTPPTSIAAPDRSIRRATTSSPPVRIGNRTLRTTTGAPTD